MCEGKSVVRAHSSSIWWRWVWMMRKGCVVHCAKRNQFASYLEWLCGLAFFMQPDLRREHPSCQSFVTPL